MATPMGVFTEDGYDYQFGANHLGHFYFTKLLLPALKAGAKSSGDDVSRIVTISSQAHILTKTINFDALKDGSARNKMTPEQLYSHSKFANIVFANELAKRHEGDDIISISLHPGLLSTDLGRHISSFARRIIHFFCQSPPDGAITQLWAGTSPDAAFLNGKVRDMGNFKPSLSA